MHQAYRGQFTKLLQYIDAQFLPALSTSNDADARAVYTRWVGGRVGGRVACLPWLAGGTGCCCRGSRAAMCLGEWRAVAPAQPPLPMYVPAPCVLQDPDIPPFWAVRQAARGAGDAAV
jgi:hypothetical protein